MIIALDGPAASGKSTTAKKAGERLNFLYIDTGAMYRAMTQKVLDSNLAFTDTDMIIKLIPDTSITQDIDRETGLTRTYLDGKDVSMEIRTPEISKGVGPVCEIKEVREALVDLQREMGKTTDVILDGRDIGTVVFPDAELKFWMDADVNVRAERRYKELVEKGFNTTVDEVCKDLIERDRRDSSRANSPMKPADNAIFIDTTNFSIEQQVEFIVEHVNRIR